MSDLEAGKLKDEYPLRESTSFWISTPNHKNIIFWTIFFFLHLFEIGRKTIEKGKKHLEAGQNTQQ